MNLMELPSIHRKIISVIIVVAIISTSMFILVDLSNRGFNSIECFSAVKCEGALRYG